ncbi:hypothetical protein PG991_015307 [Apiospora marii]|uniref:Uncharacterized protein n=1 Tax=Apiospora marii TaxID=335849 RepID=A0ABR1R206_9PEZI
MDGKQLQVTSALNFQDLVLALLQAMPSKTSTETAIIIIERAKSTDAESDHKATNNNNNKHQNNNNNNNNNVRTFRVWFHRTSFTAAELTPGQQRRGVNNPKPMTKARAINELAFLVEEKARLEQRIQVQRSIKLN